MSEKSIRGVDDHFLFHQAVTPDSRNRTYAVPCAGELAVRLLPLADGRIVLVTGDDASFFAL